MPLSNLFRVLSVKKIRNDIGGVAPIFIYELEDKYGHKTNLNDRDIARKLNKKEIEKFELEEQILKYNL